MRNVCTGFLISKDLLMTADHCVHDDNGNLLNNAIAKFGLERDIDTGNIPRRDDYSYSCPNVVYRQRLYDIAVLSCQANATGKLPERIGILFC